jgi:hypothetical protein
MLCDWRVVEEVFNGRGRRRREIDRGIAEVVILAGDKKQRLELVEGANGDVRHDLVDIRR